MLRSFSSPAVTAAIVVLCVGICPLLAQKHPGTQSRRPPARNERVPKGEKVQKNDHPLERFRNMSPAERQHALEKIPADRRKALENRLEQYNKLTPEERARFQRFNELPPERRQAVREAIGGLTKLPSERQQVVRDELRQMQGMAPAAREARVNSDDFRGKYTPEEKQLIDQLRDVVPE